MQNGLILKAGGRIVRAADLIRTGNPPAVLLRLGVPEIDAALPWGGLPSGLHDIAAPFTDAGGAGFAATLLARRPGAVLWCRLRRRTSEEGAPYGLGLAVLGLPPAKLILVEAEKPIEILWAMEEGLRARGLAAVLGEGAHPDLTASRRLQLAAETAQNMALLISSESSGEKKSSGALAAMTRWHVTSLPSAAEAGGPGRPRWKIELRRCRGGGRPQDWMVEWNDTALSLSLVPALADRPLAAAAG